MNIQVSQKQMQRIKAGHIATYEEIVIMSKEMFDVLIKKAKVQTQRQDDDDEK